MNLNWVVDLHGSIGGGGGGGGGCGLYAGMVDSEMRREAGGYGCVRMRDCSDEWLDLFSCCCQACIKWSKWNKRWTLEEDGT